MKKFAILLLAVVLTACGAPAAPTEQAAAPEPVVVTVVVEPTQAPAQPAPAEPVVVTVVVEATQVPAAAPLTAVPPTAASDASADPNAPIALDNALGAGWFVNMTRTGSNLSLRCQLYKEITFSVMPTDSNITQVDFYYRTQDKATGAVFEWRNGGRMVRDVNGNFVIVFSGEDVNPDFRKPNAWLDFQFIGSNPTGVVGRSERIVQQIDYSNDCPQ